MVFPLKELNSRWRKIISDELLAVSLKGLRRERIQCRNGYQVGMGIFPTGKAARAKMEIGSGIWPAAHWTQ